jgi:dihydrofolate synthase/folylpolyglutamate synthase
MKTAPASWLRERELLGMDFGLERMDRLMAVLGNPEHEFRSIHVVGTNGKSSTTRMIAAILERHGPQTGAYLSPHLRSFAERIEVGERQLTSQQLDTLIERVAMAARHVERGQPPGNRVTQFEALTAAAYVEFAERGVDVAVVEAGLGGRLDATNVIASDVQVLTNVGLDHTELLGSTLAEIATEKLAVVPNGGLLVVGADLHPHALGVAQDLSIHRRASLVMAPREPTVSTALRGEFERRNFALAAAAAAAFLGGVDDANILQSAASIRNPGRLEVIGRAPITVLDAAHNPDGMQALVDALPALLIEAPRPEKARVVAVISILSDKDAESMLRTLLPRCQVIVATSNSSPRARPAEQIAALSAALGHQPTVVERDPVAALSIARHLAGAGGFVLACGSLALISDLAT